MMGTANPNECGKCAHAIERTEEEPGHKTVEGLPGVLICAKCGEVCQGTPPATPSTPASATSPPAVAVVPPSTEELAKQVVSKMQSLRNEMIWKDLQRPGVIIRTVDGGYIVENRLGEEAVRTTLDDALAKTREWLSPPKV